MQGAGHQVGPVGLSDLERAERKVVAADMGSRKCPGDVPMREEGP